MMKWMFLFAVLEVAPLTLPAIVRPGGAFAAPPDARTFAGMAYVIFGATFLAYLLIPMAVRRSRPTTASMYNYVQPVVSTFAAILWGMDRFNILKVLSVILIFSGVFLVNKSKARNPEDNC